MSKQICYEHHFYSHHAPKSIKIDRHHAYRAVGPWKINDHGQGCGVVAGGGLYTRPHWSENATIYV